MPSRYEIKVQKITKNNEMKLKPNFGHTVQFTGNNSHVNINSYDSSINVSTNGITNENVFAKLKEYISQNEKIDNKNNLLTSVDNLEKVKGTNQYVEAYKSFMLVAKDCVTLISPFIPFLSSHLK